jgi:hypothetical protein
MRDGFTFDSSFGRAFRGPRCRNATKPPERWLTFHLLKSPDFRDWRRHLRGSIHEQLTLQCQWLALFLRPALRRQ